MMATFTEKNPQIFSSTRTIQKCANLFATEEFNFK